jgi:uncharacterized Zn-finger protein
MDINPWQVDSIQEFSFLKCPECAFDSKEEDTFENHAIENHPLSFILFVKSVKEECFEDPLQIKEENLYDNIASKKRKISQSSAQSEGIDITSIKIDSDLVEQDPIDDIIVRDQEQHEVKNHEKPAKPESYKCSGCKKTFPLIAHLNRHIKCVHKSFEKPKKTYNCAMCNKCFSYPSLLNRHMKQVHESSTNCLICDKNFSFPSQLKNHMAKKHCPMSKKIDYALNFDTAPIQISEVVDYQQKKIDSQTDKDEEIAAQTSLSNNEQTKKSRRKQKIALRKDF